MDRITELLLERKKLVERCREIHEKAKAENRDMTADETAEYEKSWARVEKIGEIEQREKNIAAVENAWSAPAAGEPDVRGLIQATQAAVKSGEVRMIGRCPVVDDEFSTRGYEAAFRSYLRNGRIGLGPEHQAELAKAQERALSVGIDTQGGYIVPREWAARLIQARDNMVFIRPRATLLPVNQAQSLGCPSLDADPADADWTVELSAGTEDSTMAFGARELFPRPLAKYLKVSRQLIRTSPLDVDGLVRERLAYKFAVSEENAFLNGSGAGQPLGVFTASDMGISTSRDVSAGNTLTDVTYDGLIEAKYTLKSQYWPKAAWVFHRGGVKRIAKLKDGEGRYMWQPNVQAGQPALLLDFPVFASEYAPNTWTTTNYVGMLGDFSFYWIADSLAMTVQTLLELFSLTNQTAYLGRIELDAMPVLEEAFVRVKLA